MYDDWRVKDPSCDQEWHYFCYLVRVQHVNPLPLAFGSQQGDDRKGEMEELSEKNQPSDASVMAVSGVVESRQTCRGNDVARHLSVVWKDRAACHDEVGLDAPLGHRPDDLVQASGGAPKRTDTIDVQY